MKKPDPKRLLSRSQYKTFALGLLAFSAMCYALIWVLELPAYDVLVLIGVSLGFVVVLAITGLIAAAFVRLLRRWMS